MESLELYLKFLQGCLEATRKMPSPMFNHEQCGYLVDKLDVVVQVASSFLEVSHSNHCGPNSSWNITKWVGIFKLLLALGKQVEDFIAGCSRVAWEEAAMTLTNVAEYVSSLGFNMELCKVLLFEGDCATVQSGLTWVEVDTVNKIEVEMVRLKAIVDKEYLLQKVTLALDTSNLAKYLLQRIVNVHSNPTCDEVNILCKLFAWVESGRHEEQLGRGASASVYKVNWLGTPVAKKTFFGPKNPSFLKEVAIPSQLWHPNITSMFCSTMNKRSCAIIMELMDGDLFTLIQRRCAKHSDSPPFSISEAVDLMLQIGEGVNYLHTKGIIHRDLKSMNILVKMVRVAELETGYVQAKVGDFGLSKTKERSATYSCMTSNEGTFRWMAPELVKLGVDEPECLAKSEGVLHYKFKCDVYSFAMVCYEILTGDLPFKDEWIPKTIKQLVWMGVRPELPTNCPAMLKALIEKCWIGNAKERPSFATICSTLQYLKYVLMRGLAALPNEVGTFSSSTTLSLEESSSLVALPKDVELVQGAVYEFHKPDPGQRIEVEIVFMHGLQVSVADLKDAYYKTWRTSDGKEEVWPETWLKEEFPNARILSLAYDSSAQKTREDGNMSLYLLGESLLDQMVSTAGNIGQHDCPVVFVCHSLGGLIAKEIVVRCRISDRANEKYQNLLHNLKAVFFYATPHGGSNLTDSWISNIADWFPFVEKSSLVEYLKPEGTDRTRIRHDFLQAVEKDCKFYVVAEGQKTKIHAGPPVWIVRENSARFPGPHEFVMLKDADHMTVCKPKSKNNTGYLKLIKCIDQVIEEYRRRISVDLSVNPIGIYGKIDEVSKLLRRPDVLIVGLFGMGGVGKTTLSKAFYNLKASEYVKSCYLENVKSNEVQDVQKDLFRGLFGRQLNNVEKQDLDMIKDCLLTQKVLVVLDDVSSVDCLRALQVFHALQTGSPCPSKVVVTGRDKAILPKKYMNSGKAVIEPVNGIKDPEGSDLELFLRYAFEAVGEDSKEEVKTELLGEAKKIVQLCGGLPLSLEVLGTYLGNSEYEDLQQWKETWADAYARLQNAQNLDGDKVWSSLRISYDRLGDLEQKMFLDFACIFSEIKEDKILVERIWGSSIGVQNLVNKSLLKVEGGRFVMHDQLRDMGRYMLLKEALKDHQHPIYLLEGHWHRSETYKEFKKLTTESGVPYIASVGQEVGNILRQYSKLRILSSRTWEPKTSLMDDCLSQCSGDLRWLHLKYSEVTEIGIQNLCSFGGLRVLQIFNCGKIVELPEDIGQLVNLAEIEVRFCPNFRSLPDTIGKLKKLKRLVIERARLRAVPDSVGELSEVEYLSFVDCGFLRVIDGTQICTQKLVELTLPIIPTTCLRPCPELRRLEIRNGQRVKEFPEDFFKMDMPKLEVVRWLASGSEDVVLTHPDGSELVLKSESMHNHDFEVQRHPDGSISRLIDVGSFMGDFKTRFPLRFRGE